MAKPITDTLRMLQGNALNAEAGEQLAALVKAVDETGKSGKLVLTIDVKKSGQTVNVTAECTTKVPKVKPDSDTFWPTVEGNLSVNNPAQRKLDLQPVASQTVELAKAAN